MNSGEAINILTQHNKWRRDKNDVNQYKMVDPAELGVAIELAINVLKYGGLVAINDLVSLCHKRSVTAGWWDKDSNLAEKICLIHSELSEAMEGLRKDLMDDKLPHRKMEEVEMADAVIRIFDYCGRRKFDLGATIMEKIELNATRPDHKPENRAKKGGKKF